jgi:hypothetical protein
MRGQQTTKSKVHPSDDECPHLPMQSFWQTIKVLKRFLTPTIDHNNNKIYQPNCKQPCDRSMCQMLMIYLMLEAILKD